MEKNAMAFIKDDLMTEFNRTLDRTEIHCQILEVRGSRRLQRSGLPSTAFDLNPCSSAAASPLPSSFILLPPIILFTYQYIHHDLRINDTPPSQHDLSEEEQSKATRDRASSSGHYFFSRYYVSLSSTCHLLPPMTLC